MPFDLYILGQATAPSAIDTIGTALGQVKDWLASVQIPTQAETLDMIDHMNTWHAAVLLAAGLVYLLQGWKVFKVLVIVNAAVAGVLIGSMLGALHSQEWSLYGAAIGGLALAILSWPMMRLAIALMGALAGGAIGLAAWHYVATISRPDMVQYSWVGGLLGAGILGVLAFFIFRVVVVLFTSLQGAALTVSALLALVLKHPAIHAPMLRQLEHNPLLLPLVIAVPAIIGAFFQAKTYSKPKEEPAAE